MHRSPALALALALSLVAVPLGVAGAAEVIQHGGTGIAVDAPARSVEPTPAPAVVMPDPPPTVVMPDAPPARTVVLQPGRGIDQVPGRTVSPGQTINGVTNPFAGGGIPQQSGTVVRQVDRDPRAVAAERQARQDLQEFLATRKAAGAPPPPPSRDTQPAAQPAAGDAPGTYYCQTAVYGAVQSAGQIELRPDGRYLFNAQPGGRYRLGGGTVSFDGTLQAWDGGRAAYDGSSLEFSWKNAEGWDQWYYCRR